MLLALAALPALAQEGHGFTPAELERGGILYFSSCANCHGPDGDQIGGVNLAGNRFRRAQSDTDLIAIVRKGIPGTAMPPAAYTETEAALVVGYLRSMATSGKSRRISLTGDPARGQAVVEGKGKCLNCHTIGSRGSITGPNLTAIGAARRASELELALLDPSVDIRPDNRPVRAVAKDGTKITGTLMNQDTYSLQILDSNGKLRSLSKDTLREHEVMKISPMPSYKGQLSDQEIADVVSYLVSLKGAR
ncbi:MAG: ccoP2 [Bryobacterales bacterium]|nr:ccoP2 [Bryobacterales bacterium]